MCKRCRLFFLMSLLSWISWGAQAASFDCKLSQLTDIERFICQDAQVSAMDEAIAKLYTRGYQQLSPIQRVHYLNSQRQWLAYWPQSCLRTRTAQIATAEFSQCAQRMYTQRLKTLEIQRLNNQWPVFTVAKFQMVKAHKSFVPEWVKLVDHAFLYPRIETQNLSAQALQSAEQMNVWIQSVIQKMRLKQRISLNETDMDSSLEIVLEEVSPDIVRLRTIYHIDSFGAHGNSVMHNYHYRVSKGRELTVTDFLQGPWQKPIAQEVYQKILVQVPGMVLVDSSAPIQTSIARLETWDFQRQSWRFLFSPYEVTAYAAGAPQVAIDWAIMQNYLTDYAKAQLLLMY